MLLKNLKAILKEADEAAAPPAPAEGSAPAADGTAPATPPAPLKRKPAKTDEIADSHTDDKGNEFYKIITRLAIKIETQLKLAFVNDIESFSVDNNIITVKLKKDNNVDPQGVLNVISMVYAPNVDPVMLKNFELKPQPITDDVLMITVESKNNTNL